MHALASVTVMLAAVAGCNPFYGLEPTKIVPVPDAAFFDAPTDAPFACPPVGTAPTFSRLLYQIPQSCTYYETSTATGRATALCTSPGAQIAAGLSDQTLTPVSVFEQVGTNRLDLPHLTPEGDQLFVRNWNTNTLTSKLRVFAVEGDTFTMSHEVTMSGVTFDSFVKFGRPSAGPMRRMFLQNTTASGLLEIAVEPGGAAMVANSYTPQQLGVDTLFSVPSLSSDGLRIVFPGASPVGNRIFYAARPSIDARFETAAPIADLVYNADPFLTEDCGRLYFSAIGSVFWVQQQ